MLGSAVLSAFSEHGLEATATTRDSSDLPTFLRPVFVNFDVTTDDLESVLGPYGEGDFVVNCIGIIKHHIDDSREDHRRNAILINSEFPYALCAFAQRQGFTVIQIATDCVYSGDVGSYDEKSLHDATDVYGKTKSLGEVPSTHMLNLRCSIIGRETKNGKSLLEWVLGHAPGSSFSGYTDHLWNGVTAQAFGRIAAGIVTSGNPLTGTFHLLPADVVDKLTLSSEILRVYGRSDVTVVPKETGHAINRTLDTLFPDVSHRLWTDAGYAGPPTIQDMVGDLVAPHSSYSNGDHQ